MKRSNSQDDVSTLSSSTPEQSNKLDCEICVKVISAQELVNAHLVFCTIRGEGKNQSISTPTSKVDEHNHVEWNNLLVTQLLKSSRSLEIYVEDVRPEHNYLIGSVHLNLDSRKGETISLPIQQHIPKDSSLIMKFTKSSHSCRIFVIDVCKLPKSEEYCYSIQMLTEAEKKVEIIPSAASWENPCLLWKIPLPVPNNLVFFVVNTKTDDVLGQVSIETDEINFGEIKEYGLVPAYLGNISLEMQSLVNIQEEELENASNHSDQPDSVRLKSKMLSQSMTGITQFSRRPRVNSQTISTSSSGSQFRSRTYSQVSSSPQTLQTPVQTPNPTPSQTPTQTPRQPSTRVSTQIPTPRSEAQMQAQLQLLNLPLFLLQPQQPQPQQQQQQQQQQQTQTQTQAQPPAQVQAQTQSQSQPQNQRVSYLPGPKTLLSNMIPVSSTKPGKMNYIMKSNDKNLISKMKFREENPEKQGQEELKLHKRAMSERLQDLKFHSMKLRNQEAMEDKQEIGLSEDLDLSSTSSVSVEFDSNDDEDAQVEVHFQELVLEPPVPPAPAPPAPPAPLAPCAPTPPAASEGVVDLGFTVVVRGLPEHGSLESHPHHQEMERINKTFNGKELKPLRTGENVEVVGKHLERKESPTRKPRSEGKEKMKRSLPPIPSQEAKDREGCLHSPIKNIKIQTDQKKVESEEPLCKLSPRTREKMKR
eukprot:TRINITY_DN5273_c0_g2_i4.p1 TRINITY_DN5273_c0_g2~~TRINITY_DN5273_c0_g2_i4.p1  ORF type:complete len:701 (+),score=192.84 TRINITY_DN5273_c0_g2_i4:1170-3272(+)